jgi:hypothetical protein
VLVIVDHFTKLVEAIALPDQTAETVARAAVDHFFVRFGCTLEIVTDQGTNFTSQLFTELCRWLGITKSVLALTTQAKWPSGENEPDYHANYSVHSGKKLGQMGRATAAAHGAIRCTITRSTGFTPNRLMLGREVMQPLELMTGVQAPQAPTSSYVAKLEKDLHSAHI